MALRRRAPARTTWTDENDVFGLLTRPKNVLRIAGILNTSLDRRSKSVLAGLMASAASNCAH